MKFMKFVTLGLFLLIVVGLVWLPASAQETLTYGDTVEGEITDAAFRFEYQFEGSADDIIVIHMKDGVDFGDLDSPELLLLDAGGNLIADTTEAFTYGETTLITQLSAAGAYTIVATRTDGQAGDSVGPFVLTLFQPEVIDTGAKLRSEFSSEDDPKYYSISIDAAFNLNYSKLRGDLSPQISLHALDPDAPGITEELATVSGQLNHIVLGTFEDQAPYIVIVEQALFDFHFTEVTAEFNLFVTSQ